MTHADRVFSFNRPFFDLGQIATEGSSLNALAPQLAFDALTADQHFGLQRSVAEPFRWNLIMESGMTQFSTLDPKSLRADLRTDRWQQLCDKIASFSDLSDSTKIGTVHCLLSLGFFRAAASILNKAWVSTSDGYLQYLRAICECTITHKSAGESVKILRTLLERLPTSSGARYQVARDLIVHSSKSSADAAASGRFRQVAEEGLVTLHSDSEFGRQLRLSSFYRAASYVPFLRGKPDDVERELGMAEELARIIRPSTIHEQLMARENLYFVLESRSKEAIWRGELKLALCRMQEAVDLDCWDSRARIELGEIQLRLGRIEDARASFKRALFLGPPGTIIAHHYAGYCAESLDQFEDALLHYTLGLRLDRDSKTFVEGIARISKKLGIKPAETWLRDAFITERDQRQTK